MLVSECKFYKPASTARRQVTRILVGLTLSSLRGREKKQNRACSKARHKPKFSSAWGLVLGSFHFLDVFIIFLPVMYRGYTYSEELVIRMLILTVKREMYCPLLSFYARHLLRQLCLLQSARNGGERSLAELARCQRQRALFQLATFLSDARSNAKDTLGH